MPYPKGFLFGSATSSHQIEGGDTNSDWYAWEKIPGHIKNNDSSLKGDSWRNWPKDIELLKNTGQNAYRMSIEWAKIEPEFGKFDQAAIENYKKQFQALKAVDIKIMVTLFHFSLPQWFAKKGSFANRKNICYFVYFAKKMVEEFGDLVDLWATLNEPNVYILKGYVEGLWCPGEKNYFKALKAFFNFTKAHKQVYRAIKSIKPDAIVGPVISIMSFLPAKNNLFNNLLVRFAKFVSYDLFIRLTIKHCDFLGLNYYLQTTVGFSKQTYKAKKSDYGWEIHPQGIYRICLEQAKWGIPLYITENGTADENDRLRPQFIKDHLVWLEKAIDDGAPVKGYFHWSLIDNFEWAAGYSMKFGLHTIDRKPRPSAQVYADLIKKYRQGT